MGSCELFLDFLHVFFVVFFLLCFSFPFSHPLEPYLSPASRHLFSHVYDCVCEDEYIGGLNWSIYTVQLYVYLAQFPMVVPVRLWD